MSGYWRIGLLIIFCARTFANSVESELSKEAAFQGRCGRGSPCEQLCYELHDGMYECDCTDGFELNKNGYSCEEINSTYPSNEAEMEAGLEDVLYQKGASFSAKLDETNDHIMDNSIDILRDLPITPAIPSISKLRNYHASDYIEPLPIVANSDNFYTKSPLALADMLKVHSNDRFTVREAPEINSDRIDTISMAINGASNHTESPLHSNTTPCSLDCGPEGLCDTTPGDSRVRCLCPFERTGDKCSEEIQVNVARFNRRSWLAFPAFRGAYKHVQIHIEFRPEAFDGILLLSGERDDLTGDFVALLIHQGFVEFWFDCGSGTGKLRSDEPVLLNQWNKVTIYRHRWDAWLIVNQGNRIQGRSKGLFSRITFREPVFLGGTGNMTRAKVLPVFNGFVGCIRKFIANEHEYNFKGAPYGDVAQGVDVLECLTDLCSRYACKHSGKCLLSDQGAICLCPLGFGGDLCEMRLDLQIPSFNGSSYLRFAPLGDSALIWLELKITIKPLQGDGLLLYSGHHDYGDYISMYLNMGYVEFSFDLGSGPATIRSESPLRMGQWHVIKVSRTARLAVLKIDQLPEVMTISSNGFWHLSLPHSLFLGGVNNDQTLPLSLQEKGSFNGCIQAVEINGRSLSIISEALGGSNIDNCPHACLAKPCGPLAQCVPSMESYECKCNPSNEQCNKAEEIPINFIERRILRLNPAIPVEEDNEEEEEVDMDLVSSTASSSNITTIASVGMETQMIDNNQDERYLRNSQIRQNIVTKDEINLRSESNDDYDVTDSIWDLTDGDEEDDDMDDDDDDEGELFKPFKVVLPPWVEKNSIGSNDRRDLQSQGDVVSQTPTTMEGTSTRANTEDPFLKSREFVMYMDRIMMGKEGAIMQLQEGSSRTATKSPQRMMLTTSTSVRPEPVTTKATQREKKDHGSCFTGTDSFFHYGDSDTMRHMSNNKLDINLRFKSHSDHGLLLWTGRHAARVNDNFLLLGIENGILHLRYNLGGGREIDLAFNETRVSDGLWHRVRVLRSVGEGSLEVDGANPVIEKSSAKLQLFNTNAGLYIGGMPRPQYYTRERYQRGIIGCISEVIIAADLRLNLDQSILGTAHNVKQGTV